MACDEGEICNGSGQCAVSCQNGLIDCNDTCIDPDSNPTYCGATAGCQGATPCTVSEACVDGTCIDLAFTPCTLYAIDSSRPIYQVDKTTAALTPVATAAAAAGTSGALAYDPGTNTVYLSSTGLDLLATLDLATGAVTVIGPYGDSAVVMHGLEWDTSTGTLYGVSSHNNGLYVINTTTGAATLVGTSGLTSFSNLGYDSRHDVMYLTNSSTDSAYTLNRATGAVALLGPLGTMTSPNALAYDAYADVMYVLDNSADVFGTLNRVTGAVTVVGATSGNLLGLVCVPD